MAHARRLHKTSDDRLIFGVGGGLAKYFDLDPVLVRFGLVILAFATGGVVAILYVVLALVMPEGHQMPQSSAARTEFSSDEAAPESSGNEPPSERVRSARNRTGLVVAGSLISFGLVLLLNTVGVLGDVRWDIVLPVLIIVLGFAILVPSIRS